MQQALPEEAPRVPLDADVAKKIHDDGAKIAVQAYVSDTMLTALRDALATTTSFVWFNRSETTQSLKTSQLVAGTDADVAQPAQRPRLGRAGYRSHHRAHQALRRLVGRQYHLRERLPRFHCPSYSESVVLFWVAAPTRAEVPTTIV